MSVCENLYLCFPGVLITNLLLKKPLPLFSFHMFYTTFLFQKAQFENVIQEFHNYSTTNNILIPMGGDFTYEAAEQWYINMDRLIK